MHSVGFISSMNCIALAVVPWLNYLKTDYTPEQIKLMHSTISMFIHTKSSYYVPLMCFPLSISKVIRLYIFSGITYLLILKNILFDHRALGM